MKYSRAKNSFKFGLCGPAIALYALAVLWLAPAPATAQAPKPPEPSFSEQVQELAELLGGIHYLRGLCVPSERTIWRDAMMELIRLEEPSRAQRQEMTRRFNEGYNAARERHATCTRQTRREARTQADRGARLAAALALDLRPKAQGR